MLLQLALFALVLLLWRVPIVNPVKLVVVLFHELSHVAAAYITGGVVFGIAVDPGGAGVTLGMGGNETLVVAAGYAGSLAIGIVLYALSAVWRPDEVWGLLSALCCVSMAFGWLNDFTTVFGYGTITLMVIGLFKLQDDYQKFFLRLVATTSCLYPILDVSGEFFQNAPRGFTVAGKKAGSDVMRLSEITGVSVIVIAGVWVAVGFLLVFLLLRWVSRKDALMEVKRSILQKRRLTAVQYPKYDPSRPGDLPRYEIHL